MKEKPMDRERLSQVMKTTQALSLFKKHSTSFVSTLLSISLLATAVGLLSANSKAQDSRLQQSQASGNRDDGAKKPASPANNAASNVWIVSQEDYYIGPSDVLEIKIEDAPELSQLYPVSVAGFIEMQVAGKIQAINKTPEQLAASIRESLIKADYLKRPRVSVNVTEYNSRTFFVHGSVRSAGAYKIRGKVTILDLIVLAGGMVENHGPNAYIIRRKRPAGAVSGNPVPVATAATSASDAQAANATPKAGESAEENQEYEMITANINGLERGRFNQNIVLQPGDIVNIPALNVFFIGGEVNAPGSFPLKEGTSLRQAVTLAQGTTFKAAKNRAVIFRGNVEDGKQLEIPVDIDAVMSGKKPDVLLQADDLVVVPSSRMKAIGGTVLQAFGMSTVQRGVLRY
jgi:polysaccharide export outer membrane protein